MRIPSNVSLATWIKRLIAEDRIYKFYKTDEWLELKDQVLTEGHNECAMCAEEGKYSRAVTVHHVMEVKAHPELALSKFYRDKAGALCVNLIPLCFICHNKIHKRFGFKKSLREQLNQERWD